MENEVVQLYLDDIIPNRFQPREVFNDQALKELAVSIREHGVIQPILVRKFGEKYEIIAGERRYKASTMAGLTKIPAIVKNLDDKESSKVALIENLQRRDLTPIEEARTYQKILDLDEMTQEDLAKTMGKSQSAVSNKLRLLSLPDEIQEALLKEEISERHARSLLNVSDKNTQIDLLKEIVTNKMTVRELDSRIKSLNGTGSNDDTSVSGGTTNAPVEVDQNNTEVKPVEKNNNESLFGNNQVNISEVNNMGENNMNENNENSFFNANAGIPDLESNNSFFSAVSSNQNDPTTVDIEKIKEGAFDINPSAPVEPSKDGADIKNLIKPQDSSNDFGDRFIPNFMDNTIEKTEDGNEVIGNGLLAGMPVIKPADEKKEANNTNANPVPTQQENNNKNSLFGENNSLFGDSQPVEEKKEETTSLFASDPTSVQQGNSLFETNTLEEPKTESLFGGPTVEPKNNNNNSLFGEPAPVQTEQAPANNSLFGDNVSNVNVNDNNINNLSGSLFGPSDSNSNAVIGENVISNSNNSAECIGEIKDLLQKYEARGVKASVEQLDLDNEIQLIIKINKN